MHVFIPGVPLPPLGLCVDDEEVVPFSNYIILLLLEFEVMASLYSGNASLGLIIDRQTETFPGNGKAAFSPAAV